MKDSSINAVPAEEALEIMGGNVIGLECAGQLGVDLTYSGLESSTTVPYPEAVLQKCARGHGHVLAFVPQISISRMREIVGSGMFSVCAPRLFASDPALLHPGDKEGWFLLAKEGVRKPLFVPKGQQLELFEPGIVTPPARVMVYAALAKWFILEERMYQDVLHQSGTGWGDGGRIDVGTFAVGGPFQVGISLVGTSAGAATHPVSQMFQPMLF